MDRPVHDTGYNERLFGAGGIRRYYHMARFNWARRKAAVLGDQLRLVELGCFDARLLEALRPQVARYVGVDANWENGLDQARGRFGNDSAVTLIESVEPSVFDQFGDGEFTLAAALETLEHLPPAQLEAYLHQMARVTRGHLLVTVPNEMGPVFLAKYAAKKLVYGAADPYTFREFVAAVLRQSDRIERDEHKGFDYRKMVDAIARRFDLLAVESVPPLGLPPALSATVGIVAKSQKLAKS